MKKKKFCILSFIFIIWFLVGTNFVYADCMCVCTNGDHGVVDEYTTCSGHCGAVGVTNCYDVGQTGNPAGGGAGTLKNPLGDNMTPEILIGKIINAIIGIVGSLALVMFVYGGFMWMLSAGSKERVQKGKDIIAWATIGLVVIFSAYALVRFVFKAFGG